MSHKGCGFLNRGLWIISLIVIIMLLSLTTVAMAEPRIVSVSPGHLSQLDKVTRVTATVSDATVVTGFNIDGKNVACSILGNTVTTCEQNFAVGLHKVYLSVADNSGLTAEKAWQFYVNDFTNSYMLTSNATCEKCHPNTWKNRPGHLVDLALPNSNGGHPYSCGACHYYKATEEKLIVRADGTYQISSCTPCHGVHSGMGGTLYLPPKHGNINWKGNWSDIENTIKKPRVSLDCQYCHQTGTKVRMGHDLVSDHVVDEPACTSCHSGILTAVHNKNGKTCETCHESLDSVVKSVASAPMVAKAGNHITQTLLGTSGTSSQYYNDLGLGIVSINVYGPDTEAVSQEWTPGQGLLIKRIYVDGWKATDKQYILAYVKQEDEWYTISVPDDGELLYRRSPGTSMARLIYLPDGTTKIKTMVRSGSGDEAYLTGLEVKAAYYNKSVKCTDCHTGHEEIHVTTVLDEKCTSCHMNSLTQEHLGNPRTQKQTLNCETCHKSSNPAVAGAIISTNKNCAGCHSLAHQLSFKAPVVSDIPLYAGFTWSAPMNCLIWENESWMPDEFLGGKVVFSNRRRDISGDDVWLYYQKEMTARGWTLVSATPTAGSNFYSVTFTKGNRKAMIWFYGGDLHAASPVVSSGYRIEILYK